MIHNEYDVELVRVIDGDTVDVNIILGFGVCLQNERVRIVGIDTPESRTRDSVEKLFGLAAKYRLDALMKEGVTLVTMEDNSGEDVRGKFGRVLGDFRIKSDGQLVTDIMIKEGYGVKYDGGSKSNIRQDHLENRHILLERGVVNMEQYLANGGTMF